MLEKMTFLSTQVRLVSGFILHLQVTESESLKNWEKVLQPQ